MKRPKDDIDRQTLRSVAGLLNYSFHDIEYTWDGLTTKEKSIIGTKANYGRVLDFIRTWQ